MRLHHLLILGLAFVAIVVALALPRERGAYATHTPPSSNTLNLHAGDSIQTAIDYAVSQGAEQHQTYGTTEQGGHPWVIVLHPGEYVESGIVMRSGVNITALMERTVMIASAASSPVITCAANATISGVTIVQDNPDYPALLVTDPAIQCSVHRAIIEAAGVAVRQEGGFFRAFDTDFRNGYLDLVPTVNYPLTNPVGMNLVRSRAWADPIRISGTNNALLMLQNSHLDGMGITSTATGNFILKLSGNTALGNVTHTGMYTPEIRDSDIDTLSVAVPTTVYGGFLGSTVGPVTWLK